MDPRIEALRSTTFFGRRLTRQQISEIQTTVAAFPSLSRHELQMSGPRGLIEGVFGGRFSRDFGELGGI